MYTKEQAQEYKEVYDKWLVSGRFTFDDYIDEYTEKAKPYITVKIDGLGILKKAIDELDTEEIVKNALIKALEPELKPCPFCGSMPEVDKGLVRCGTENCPGSDWVGCGKWHNRDYGTNVNKVDIEEATRLVKEQGKFCYLSIMRRLGIPYWKARELKSYLQEEGIIDDRLKEK